MKRPFILSLMPPRWRESVTSRIYLRQFNKWRPLYEVARLALCPRVSMYDLIPGDIISGNIAFNGFYEMELSHEIARLSFEGALFVDVGANMGYFSLIWAGLNPRGRVIAFEPAPRNIKLLENNIKKAGLTDRVTLVPKAAGHKTGTVHFNTGSIDQTGWGGISSETSDNNLEVPVVRLDDELAGSMIDVLKIDVEGADTWVLYGCEGLLRKRQIRRIFFEENRPRMVELGIGANETREFLASVGYACRPFGKGCGEWEAYPIDRPANMQDQRAP